jgi:hypothetical protein
VKPLILFFLGMLLIVAVSCHPTTPPTNAPATSAATPKKAALSEFTGRVVQTAAGYRFDNDDGTKGQRLTKAKLGESPQSKEIDLKPYADESLKVRGQWEHDWIMEAEVLEHHRSK